jgi:regulatory protein
MAMELRQKGLDDDTVKSAIQHVDDEPLAYEAAKKRAARYEELEWQAFRKKLTDFLARRGFSYSVTARVVARVWNEAHAQELYHEDED